MRRFLETEFELITTLLESASDGRCFGTFLPFTFCRKSCLDANLKPAQRMDVYTVISVPAKAGTYYPMTELDVKFESTTYSQKSASSDDSEESARALDIRLTAKNDSPNPVDIYASIFTLLLRDADGNDIVEPGNVSGQARSLARIKTGADKELKIRFRFEVPTDVELKTFSIRQGTSLLYS